MSDSMERDKIDSMAAKELEEEEEMKRELLDMGMYETWYTYKEMKDVLGFISESKNMANMANDNKNANKEPTHTSDSTSETHSKTNTSQEVESQDHNDMPRSIHFYRPNHTSPILDQISTHSSSSPESMSTIFESRNSTHRHKSSDIDDMYDRCPHENLNIRDNSSHSTNRYVSLRPKGSLQEPHNVHGTETKMNAQYENNQKLDRWRINPLDCCVNENDVPLRQPDRPVVQDREPFRYCKDAQTPEMLEKVLPALNLHLKEMAELWHSWHRTTDSKFQWGSPIQVGTANGSLDKRPLTITETEQTKTECTVRHNHERACKRKPALPLSPPNTMHFSSDEEEKAEFVAVKKKKIQYDRHDRISRVPRSARETRVYEDLTSSSRIRDDEDSLLDNEPVGVISDDNEPSDARTKIQTQSKEERLSPILVSEYPRRIIPPNPKRYMNSSKKKKSSSHQSSSAHDNDDESITLTSRLDRGSSSTSKQNTPHQSQKDVANDKTTSNNITLKPLVMKRLSVRLEKQSMLLKKVHEDQQKKKDAEKEEAHRKEEEEKRRREEFYKKQEEERIRRHRQREEAQKREAEKSAKWNNVLHTRFKESRDRSARDLEAIRLSEIEEENRLLQDDDEDEEPVGSSVACPICNKAFPKDKIEAHAAACDQFGTDNDEESSAVPSVQRRPSATKKSSRNVMMYECNICSTFKTDNGTDYEDHVNSCIERRYSQSEQPQPRVSERTSNRILNVPTSPIRCFRPISELTDSEIDYKSQFGTTSKSFNRKRKR